MSQVTLLVGLPGVGKTTRAKAIESATGALRLTPDDWLRVTLGSLRIEPVARYRLEGMLLRVGRRFVALGGDLIVDFGLWGRDERTGLRAVFMTLGADVVVEYLDLDPVEQRRRLTQRDTGTDWVFTDADLAGWAATFQPPTSDELAGGPLDPVPNGYRAWDHWAADLWPGL